MTVRTGIVLINYNNIDDTRLCLASLAHSSVPLAIVVVDNASRGDDAASLRAEFPHVHVIASDVNVGFGRANNLGLRWLLTETACEFLFVLNNDTTIAPDTVAQLEAALAADDEAGAVAPRIVFMHDPSLLWYGGGEINWRTGTAITPGFRGPAEATAVLQRRYVTFASGCAVMLRRRVLQTIGGFDPRIFMYEEDVDLSLRVSEAEWRLLYVPESIVYHKGHGAQREDTFKRGRDINNPRLPFFIEHRVRNRLLNMDRHARGRNALLFGVFFPLWVLRELQRFVMHRRWDAVRALFAGIAHYWQARRLPFQDELAPAQA